MNPTSNNQPHARPFPVKVLCTSMWPEFTTGDWIIVDPKRPYESDDIVLVVHDDKYTICARFADDGLDKYLLFDGIPDGSNRPPIKLTHSMKVVGTVVAVVRHLVEDVQILGDIIGRYEVFQAKLDDAPDFEEE